jgi:inosose dehydratase
MFLMNLHSTRRTFLAGLGAAGAVAALPAFAAPERLSGVRFGYAAITWGNEERQAIDDIAAAGYPGVQFRANAVTEFQASGAQGAFSSAQTHLCRSFERRGLA